MGLWSVSLWDSLRLEKTLKILRRGIQETYFDPVALVIVLLRGDARRVERFGWALDAAKADKTTLAVVSSTKRRGNFMTKLG